VRRCYSSSEPGARSVGIARDTDPAQLIEHTDFGVRSAFLTYAKRGGTTRFVLTPMLHVGSLAIYKNVQLTLNDCDIVLAGGVRGGDHAC
jgi:hypothetical protein